MLSFTSDSTKCIYQGSSMKHTRARSTGDHSTTLSPLRQYTQSFSAEHPTSRFNQLCTRVIRTTLKRLIRSWRGLAKTLAVLMLVHSRVLGSS